MAIKSGGRRKDQPSDAMARHDRGQNRGCGELGFPIGRADFLGFVSGQMNDGPDIVMLPEQRFKSRCITDIAGKEVAVGT